MKGTNRNRCKQILSLLMVMAVGASTMIIAPHFTAKTTDTQPETVQSVNADTANIAVSDTADPSIEIVSFKSDTQGIPVGTSQDVIFSAEIKGNVGTDEHDVSLYDDADHLIGYLLDNGENGDEAADDGVFTLTTALSSDEEKYVHYHPRAKGVDGDSVMIGFYTPVSEEAMEEMDDTEAEISTFVSDDSFRSKSDDEKASAAGSFLDQLAQDGKIKSGTISYDEDRKIYSFEYNTSTRGALCLTEFSDETNGADDAEPIDLIEQFPITNSTNTTNAVMTEESNSSDAIASTGANGSYRALVLNGFENSSFRRDYYQSLKSNWSNKGLSTTVDVDVTVSDLKNLGSYDVVVFAMHGNVDRYYSSDPWDPILSLNQTVTSSTDSAYSYELTTRHSIEKVTLSGGTRAYWVFPKLFTDSYSSSGLSGKLIYSETCCFYGCDSVSTSANYNMSNALRNRGASVVVGYHNSVNAEYSRNMMKYVIDRTYDGMTVSSALNNAKSVYGSTDGTSERAYPIVNPSNSSFVLRSVSSAAEAISMNSTKTASISSAGGMKYYKITPSATTQIQFYSTGSYDTLGYLYNASMSQLASNDDGGSDHNFKISYTMNAGTTYYLGCKFYSSSRTGSFSVTLSGNTYEDISIGASKTASINAGGSMKYYKITPSATTQVQFYSTGSYDTLGYLYNASMSQLASNDDGGTDHNFKLTYTLNAGTTYILGCRFYSDTRTGSFNVRLENMYESISLNSTKTASINAGGFMKYYKITPASTTQIQFYSTGSYDTLGYLYNASMSQLTSNDDGGADHNFKLTYTLSGGSTYILGCRFYSDTRTGSFSVTLNGSSFEDISIGASKTASISSAGGMKYYKITPSVTTQVQFYSTGSYDTLGYLYNASMSQLSSNDDGGADHNFKITYTLSAGTTYILGCRFYSDTRTGSFNVRLESAYESISLNSTKTAAISSAGSVKYYTYTPSTSGPVQFYSTGSCDTYGYLYNASMSRLAADDDGGSNFNFCITYHLNAGNTYIFGCKLYDASKTGSFSVRLESSSESITLNSSKTASISSPGAVKYYTITPGSTTKVQFCSSGGYDSCGYLYDANMNQLAYNDDGGYERNFKITYTLQANTRYCFACKLYSASNTGSFTVRLDTVNISSVTPSITTAGTARRYSITPSVDKEITIYSIGSRDTYCSFYDANMNLLASNDDGGDDRNFLITYTLRANTKYYFDCKFYSSSETGSFTVYVETAPAYLNAVSRAAEDENSAQTEQLEIVEITDDADEIGAVTNTDAAITDDPTEMITREEEQIVCTETVPELSE